MHSTSEQNPQTFTERRKTDGSAPQGTERRQFKDARAYSREEVRELAEAVDQYKMRHRRRFITYEELFDVVASLGYHK